MPDDLGDAVKRAKSKKLRDGLTAAAERQAAATRTNGPTFTGWKGAWNKTTEYQRGNVVSHEGSSWRAVADHRGSEPPSTMWQYVAKKGQDGKRGADGIGVQGPPGAPQTPATTVVSETAFGQAPAVGVDLDYAREDHTHGTPPAPAGGVPSDTVVTEQTFGQNDDPGVSLEFSRGDHTHGTPAAPSVPSAATTVEDETTYGITPAVGIDTEYARQDHTHGSPPTPDIPDPASTVVTETSFGQASAVGVGTDYARDDHTHGTPAAPTFPNGVPVGAVLQWFTSTEPTGWLFIEGQTGLSRATYSALFALWGPAGSNILGPGNGTTTFDMPSFRGDVIVGQSAAGLFSAALGSKVGSQTDTITDHVAHSHGVGTLDAAAEASHTHGVGTYDAAAEASHTHAGPSHTHGVGTYTSTGHVHQLPTLNHQHGVGTLDAAAESSHVHSVNPPSTTSSGPTGTVSDVTRTGTAGMATSGHSHTTDIAAFDSAAGSSHDHALSGSTAFTAPGLGDVDEATDSLTGSSAAGGTGNTGAGSSHDHALSGSSAAGSSHDHALSGSTANNTAQAHDTIDIVQPSVIGKHIVYTGV